MGRDNPPEVLAVFDGMPTLVPYLNGGGKFTGQKNAMGQTAGMMAAMNSAEVIELFVKAGGRFTDERDWRGRTAAFYAVEDYGEGLSISSRERPAAIVAFGKMGGHFTDEQDNNGFTAAMVVLGAPKDIPAFLAAGGRFGTKQSKLGETEGTFAVRAGVASIQAFSAGGGKFTSLQDLTDKTAGDYAAKRGGEVLEAYRDAVARQGGLVYLSTDNEFQALRNPGRVESFVKAGGHFDDQIESGTGWAPAMAAAWAGIDVFQAFVKYGGRLTTQQDAQGRTAEDFVRQRAGQIGYPGFSLIYNEAVKRQGGLITLMPKDEYEAARIGAPAITMFARSGGKFTEQPNADGLTSAMIAASRGAEATEAYAKAGGHFSDWQNANGYTVAMVAVLSGADAIQAFGLAGGKFTNQQDHHGMTAAMWAASRSDIGWPNARMELKFPERVLPGGLVNSGGAAIEAFQAAGGQFNDHQDMRGYTAAMLAVENGPDAIRAFAAAGGHFTEQEDKGGYTAEALAAYRTPDRIEAFFTAGGRFTDHLSSTGISSEFLVAQAENPAMITAYSKAGGLFTDRKYTGGWTSEMLASNLVDWMSSGMGHGTASGLQINQQAHNMWKVRFGARDVAAAEAYREAVQRQGGLRHVE